MIQDPGEAGDAERKDHLARLPDHVDICEMAQVLEILEREPVELAARPSGLEPGHEAQEKLPDRVRVRKQDARSRVARRPRPREHGLDVARLAERRPHDDEVEGRPGPGERLELHRDELEVRMASASERRDRRVRAHADAAPGVGAASTSPSRAVPISRTLAPGGMWSASSRTSSRT